MSIAPLHETFDVEPAPIYAAVVDLHTRRPVLRVVRDAERIPVCRPSDVRLAVLNGGTGVSGAILWSV